MNSTKRQARNQEIIDDYNSRMKIVDIARKHDLSVVSLSVIIRAARTLGKITWNGREDKLERNQSIIAQYESGLTMESVAKGYGLSRERIRQILSDNGIESRSLTQANEEAYRQWALESGDEVNETFNLVRNISGTAAALPTHPTTWVRRFLSDRKHESIRTKGSEKFWDRERLLAVLKDASVDGILTIPRYQKWRNSGVKFEDRTPPTHAIIVWTFGSWNNALSLAGITSSERKNNRIYSRTWSIDDAYSAVRVYSSEMMSLGKRPTFAGYAEWSHENPGYPSNTYIRVLTHKPWAEILREVMTPTKES